MKRSKHSLSHYKLASFDMGELVPVGLTEVLPGDTFQHAASALIRVSPLLAPVMHPVHVKIHHWFVPHRLVWDDWEDFITGGPDGDNSSAFPVITTPASTGFDVGSLADYLGVPTGVPDMEVSALPFRAYNLIWNEWYRDQDLQTPLTIDTSDGSDTTTETDLQNVAWEKDYFTSARPWTQKGPEVSIPLTGDAPVASDAVAGQDDTLPIYLPNDGGSGDWYNMRANSTYVESTSNQSGMNEANKLYADLSDVTSASVNDLRLALALQRYEEARARYGSRYVEYLRYLGVKSSDARLQRPEYLGGGKQTIQFSEVLQTAEGTDPVGELRGHGISAVRSNRYRRFFEEHGYVISFISIKPKTMYVQGLPRTWNRRTKEDFFQRELQAIGQQEVLNKELYLDHSNPDEVFGYQDRYDEYRRSESLVSGEFRDNTLDYWHMARIFGSDPALNASFVESNPTKRINAVQDNDVIWAMVNHSLQARRLVNKTGKSYIY